MGYLYRSAPTVYQNSSLVSYFKQQVHDGATIVGLFQWPLKLLNDKSNLNEGG